MNPAQDRKQLAEIEAIASWPAARARYDWRARCSTASKLQTMTFPPVTFVIPGLIPEGLTLLAGRPKIGKSWLALDICLGVAAGRFCLGDRQPLPGDVLYAALEDNPRRLQRRMGKILRTFTETWPDRLTVATEWRRLDKGGVEDLAEWIDGAHEPRLIVLDTLAGVKPIRTTTGYTEDYASLEALHRLANDRGVAIVVLHHTRKMEAEDPLDSVSGTLGLAGCADTVAVLTRSSKGPTLYLRGRDVEEAEHAMSFSVETCRWTILGDAGEVRRSEERSRILDAIAAAAEPIGPTDIAAATGMKPGNVRHLLSKMAGAGEVKTEGRGRYVTG